MEGLEIADGHDKGVPKGTACYGTLYDSQGGTTVYDGWMVDKGSSAGAYVYRTCVADINWTVEERY